MVEIHPTKGFWLKLALSVVITAGIVSFLLRYVSWSDLQGLFSRANLWLLTVPPTLVLMYFVRAWAFRLLAPTTPLGSMWSIMAMHNFLLRVLPMRMGELSYAFLVRHTGAVDLGSSLIGLLLIRLLDATVIVVIFAGALLFDSALYYGDASLGLAVAAGGIALGVAMVFALRPLLAAGVWCLSVVLRLLGLQRRPRVASGLAKMRETVDTYARYSLRFIFAQACLAALVWALNFLMVYQILRGFGIQASLPQAVLGSTAATLSSLLPVGGIGSFGALEAGWVLGFSLVGFERNVAVASALGYSLYTFVLMGLFAIVGAWLSRRSRP
ncbi:MAG: flippase-like domain-containing protein [Deltaproteobacteria bacterium]|nr:flippase-like domain-containing protein [Deltaproteobacteria bacterium]